LAFQAGLKPAGFQRATVDHFRQLGIGLINVGNTVRDGLVAVQVRFKVLIGSVVTNTTPTLKMRRLVYFETAIQIAQISLI